MNLYSAHLKSLSVSLWWNSGCLLRQCDGNVRHEKGATERMSEQELVSCTRLCCCSSYDSDVGLEH